VLPGYEPTETQKAFPEQLIAASEPVGTVGFRLGCNFHAVLALTVAADVMHMSATTNATAVRPNRESFWIREYYRRPCALSNQVTNIDARLLKPLRD